MTQKLFLDDSYLKECTAKVVAAEGNKLELDKTVFYPAGGGQPSDVGEISCGERKAKVLAVRSENGLILHEVDLQSFSAGDKVNCVLDWGLRYKHMRMHTSAHILAAVIFKQTGALITGNQLSAQESRMDFSVKDFDRNFLTSIEKMANDAVAQNLQISISYEGRVKALQKPELFRLKDVLPKNIPVLRIVSIGNFDIQADGGTHVKNTLEVGKIKITDLKNKGAENRRIYWVLE